MNIIAIIQARMGSMRLPGKMLLDLAGKPVIQRVYERAEATRKTAKVVVATTTLAKDDELEEVCQNLNIPVFRGSEDDVLDRYYRVAEEYEADAIVRITGDCPLIDPIVSDGVISLFLSDDYDYVTNTHPPTFPDGLDTSIFSFPVLKKAWRNAIKDSEREHVTAYFINNENMFNIGNFSNEKDLSHYRWTLDEYPDYKVISFIYNELERTKLYGNMDEILEIFKRNRDLHSVNNQFERNEGYLRSILKETGSYYNV